MTKEEIERLRLLVDDEYHLSWAVAQRLCQRHNEQRGHNDPKNCMFIYRARGACVIAKCSECIAGIIVDYDYGNLEIKTMSF